MKLLILLYTILGLASNMQAQKETFNFQSIQYTILDSKTSIDGTFDVQGSVTLNHNKKTLKMDIMGKDTLYHYEDIIMFDEKSMMGCPCNVREGKVGRYVLLPLSNEDFYIFDEVIYHRHYANGVAFIDVLFVQ